MTILIDKGVEFSRAKARGWLNFLGAVHKLHYFCGGGGSALCTSTYCRSRLESGAGHKNRLEKDFNFGAKTKG